MTELTSQLALCSIASLTESFAQLAMTNRGMAVEFVDYCDKRRHSTADGAASFPLWALA